MGNPTTIGTVGLGSSAAGGALSAFGAAESGAAQQSMFNYQSAVATINSNIDKQNAEYAMETGELQAQQYGRSAAQQRGQILAAQGGTNIDVNSGSAARVRSSQQTITALDLAQIRNNSAKTAYDYDVKSTMDLNQATLDTMAGANAKLAGDINATSSILGSVSSVSSKWLQGNQQGLGGIFASS